MRVIAGERGHLKLVAPEGMDTRPTTDRIKETLFNMIQFDVKNSNFLDLFSGSGQMGIEALSRGAYHATFVEKDRKAIDAIKINLKTTRYEDKATVLRENVFDALRGIKSDNKFDIVFMDPPYAMHQEAEVLTLLTEFDLIYNDSIIIIEADRDRSVEFVDKEMFKITNQKIYKTNQHIFLKPNR